MSVLKRFFGSDTLEAMHRMNWRRYMVWAFLAAFGPASLAGAATVESKLISKEGERVVAGITTQVPTQTKPVKHVPRVVLPQISKEDMKAEGQSRTVKGVVSGRSNYGIAVEYGADPVLGVREMWLDLMKQTELTGVKKFSDLEAGDTVELVYKQLKDGSKKILKQVKLIRKAPKELQAQESAQ